MEEIKYPQNNGDTKEGNEGNYLAAISMNLYKKKMKGEINQDEYDFLVKSIKKQSVFINDIDDEENTQDEWNNFKLNLES